ncbi:MAG TPA: asparagine synthase (glutamine-hydrolyzing) [Kiritimatiellia bacterium]|nr:asparagine synthase (glutamine-hydrolyzing) [Kiritimatiellia bacterium]
MCGIAGIVDFGKPIEPGLLGSMLDLIIHRGPDDEGRYVNGPYAMGMRRLSIIDLGGGHQPISNEDESVWVVFNGEIYNYVELRGELESRGHVFRTNTDTECLVHLYEQYGDAFPEKLNGMFGFAVWDVRRDRVLLARDHLGIKPLYWHFKDGRLVFGSELRCLLAGGVQPALDRDAIAAYLHLGYIPRSSAPIRGVSKLQPGHVLLWDRNGSPRASAYWRLADAYARVRDIPLEEAATEARELLQDAVRLQLRSDVPLGTFLSGGIDSSAVTALAARQLPHVDTFGMGFSDHYYDETEFARMVAKHCGTRHHEQHADPANLLTHLDLLAWHLDEPNSDPALLPSYLICRSARQHVKVALSGNGGDEVFAGYPRHVDPPPNESRADRFRRWMPASVRRALATLLGAHGESRLRRLLADNDLVGMGYWVEQARLPVAEAVVPWACRHFSTLDWIQGVFGEVPGADWVNRRLYYDSTSYMPDQILNMVDRASMAVSLEVRVPLLDVRLVELMAGVAGSTKIEGGGSGKAVLKRAMRDLLPDEIFTRRKLGFGLPMVNWIGSGPVREVLDRLPSGRAAAAGLLDGAALRPWIARPQALKDHWPFFWNLVMLELWLGQLGRPRPTSVDA